jgi:hypothetical protein
MTFTLVKALQYILGIVPELNGCLPMGLIILPFISAAHLDMTQTVVRQGKVVQ